MTENWLVIYIFMQTADVQRGLTRSTANVLILSSPLKIYMVMQQLHASLKYELSCKREAGWGEKAHQESKFLASNLITVTNKPINTLHSMSLF